MGSQLASRVTPLFACQKVSIRSLRCWNLCGSPPCLGNRPVLQYLLDVALDMHTTCTRRASTCT